MPWYKTGTVSVVQNSNAVIGTGTAFIANAMVGDAFRGPDGAWYEVINIASNAALSIEPTYQGTTNPSGLYALAPMQGYVKDSAAALRALANQFGDKLAALGTTGNYEILPLNKGGTGVAAASNAELLKEIGAVPLLNAVQTIGAVPLEGALEKIGALPVAGGAFAPKLTSVGASGSSVPTTPGGYIGWSEGAAGLTGEMAFTCNQGGGTGGFSWRTVNQGNNTSGPVVSLTKGGVFNAVGLMVAGKNVVENGSNSNGDYVRFSDGTRICWRGGIPFGPTAPSTPATIILTPAAAFATNKLVVVIPLTQAADTNDAFRVTRCTANLWGDGDIRFTFAADVSQVYRLGYLVIGRWF